MAFGILLLGVVKHVVCAQADEHDEVTLSDLSVLYHGKKAIMMSNSANIMLSL